MNARMSQNVQPLIETQIKEGIPTILLAAGYPNGTYEIKRLSAVDISGKENYTDGKYMELVVELSGTEGKIDNLKKGLEMFMLPNAGVEILGNIITFRKKLEI